MSLRLFGHDGSIPLPIPAQVTVALSFKNSETTVSAGQNQKKEWLARSFLPSRLKAIYSIQVVKASTVHFRNIVRNFLQDVRFQRTFHSIENCSWQTYYEGLNGDANDGRQTGDRYAGAKCGWRNETPRLKQHERTDRQLAT